MSESSIRPARLSDAVAVAACIDAAYSHYTQRIGKPPGPMLRDYEAEIGEHDAYLLEQDKEVIGVLVLIGSDDGLLLDNVAVLPRLQGQGFGRALIAFAEEQALSQGFNEITLYTHERMTENLALCLRFGYEETDRKTVDGYHRVYMRKLLGANVYKGSEGPRLEH